MLTVNISELILTILNFLLLYLVLDKLLFKPLISFMDERQARIEEGLRKERAADAAVQVRRQRSEERESARRKDAERRLAEARAANLLRHEQHLNELKAHRNSQRLAIEKDVELIEERERAELASEGKRLAGILAQRLINGPV